ncbi:MAG: carbamoyltransferase HypF [Lentisphaeria bacterium]|nr:carbamoyltransferase HypF [Lentisphaeria bacterium]
MRSGIIFRLAGNTRIGGFKSFFWDLAAENALTGWIRDSENGAELYLQGEDDQIRDFIRLLPSQVPGAFRLRSISILKRQAVIPEDEYCNSFVVLPEKEGEQVPDVKPDRKPCEKCIAESRDPAQRRFEHPFFSCRDCGPVYSSALRTPFVRQNTVLTAFPPCPECKKEQEDKSDLLHYASEGLSCPECGPRYFMLDMYGDLVMEDHVLQEGQKALKAGSIVALQSIYGGFQIFADAFDEEVISHLRRKRKLADRPLCLMARNMEVIRKICICSKEEEDLLQSDAAPVVLLQRRKDPELSLSPNIAPGCRFLAVSLPTSMPEVLFFRGTGGEENVLDLAVTCGDNPPGKAECGDVDEIFNRLMSFTDCFLCHDMKTPHPCPGSIVMLHEGRVLFIRKARGYVPEGIKLATAVNRCVGAFGCDAQASVALGIGKKILHSQSLGQMTKTTHAQILQDLFERFCSLFDRVPEIMACDMDSDTLSARLCNAYAEKHNLLLVTIQTHHAHALACMAEHHLTRALGIVMNDGSMGPDGEEWGSECLDARLDGFSRIASFKAVSKHNSRPARLFLESLAALQEEHAPESLLSRLGVDLQEYTLWRKQMSHQENLQTHSALKVINTVCAGMGIAPDFATYPMHCMTLLEDYVSKYPQGVEIPSHIKNAFTFRMQEENGIMVLDWTGTILNLSKFQTISEEEKPFFARAFYDAFSCGIIAMSIHARERTSVNDLVLSGSLFLNSILLSTVHHQLEANGFRVYLHQQSACDESCVPIGQAYAAGLTAR